MDNMFRGATSFNADISDWDVTAVQTLTHTFEGATSFNIDLAAWRLREATTVSGMFNGASAFIRHQQASVLAWKNNTGTQAMPKVMDLYRIVDLGVNPAWAAASPYVVGVKGEKSLYKESRRDDCTLGDDCPLSDGPVYFYWPEGQCLPMPHPLCASKTWPPFSSACLGAPARARKHVKMILRPQYNVPTTIPPPFFSGSGGRLRHRSTGRSRVEQNGRRYFTRLHHRQGRQG
jgi:surface protein